MVFEIAGVHVSPVIPVMVGFLVALVTTPAGISGAFLLLPIQVTLFGFGSPAVTPTNLLFNVVSTPGGVYGYMRRSRIDWSLAKLVLAGSLPGVVIGAMLRIHLLANSADFRLFAGAVLVVFAARLYLDVRKYGSGNRASRTKTSTPIVAVSVVVGLIGGIYGIGGGAFIAPFLVSVLGFTMAEVAGVALLSTLVSSIIGIAAFIILRVPPDFFLGALFGVGGLAGSYLGARLQNRMQEGALRVLLSGLVGSLGITYLVQGFRSKT